MKLRYKLYFSFSIPTPGFPHFYYMLGANLGLLLYGEVSVMLCTITWPNRLNRIRLLSCRFIAFNLSLHLLFLIALQPRIAHTYSLFSWLKANASKTKGVNLFCLCKLVEPGTAAKKNAKFTIQCIIFLLVLNVVLWLFVLLLCAGDIYPNPGPQSVSSSSSSSIASNMSTDVFSSLSISHNLSFVKYNVKKIVNKLDLFVSRDPPLMS